jgi:NADP-dependent 3-hydroxy acid dehydrogenase YdfG
VAGSALILGARNLGGAIADHLRENGWETAAVARSRETLEAVGSRGHRAIAADASSVEELTRAIAEAGDPELIVNAVSASRPPRSGGPFGGGPLDEADLQDFQGWTVAVAEQAFVFLHCGIACMKRRGGGTLIQMTGGSSRRAIPERGLWAAGAFATKAMVHAAAQELRSQGIHVALVAVDATIESPKTAGFTSETPREALADQRLIAAAVRYLAEQQPRAWTHELTLTPSGDRWLP